jgi:hypothetical protein
MARWELNIRAVKGKIFLAIFHIISPGTRVEDFKRPTDGIDHIHKF